MLRKIAIIGPESTGKSRLSEELAAFYDTVFSPEFARGFLNGLGRNYNRNDLLHIAKKQEESIQSIQLKAKNYFFSDTEMMVIKIWSEFKYKSVHPWILSELKKQDFDLYLLTDIDLLWEKDELREHPHHRKRLLKLYEKELEKRKWPFIKISGQGKQRTLNAIKAIDDFFQEK